MYLLTFQFTLRNFFYAKIHWKTACIIISFDIYFQAISVFKKKSSWMEIIKSFKSSWSMSSIAHTFSHSFIW